MPRVKFFATLREITGRREETVPGETVGEVLNFLYDKYGEDFRRELERKSMILVNGKNVEHLKGMDTEVKEEDEVSIFPPAGGG